MKICLSCKELKELGLFNKNKSKPDGYQGICRVCDNARAKLYYSDNRERMVKQINARNKRVKVAMHEWVCCYLDEHPCVDCGEDDIVVLEFDHLGDKEYDVSTLYLKGWGIDKIQKEISKCEVVCSNCHRRRTARRGNHYRYVRQLNPVG